MKTKNKHKSENATSFNVLSSPKLKVNPPQLLKSKKNKKKYVSYPKDLVLSNETINVGRAVSKTEDSVVRNQSFFVTNKSFNHNFEILTKSKNKKRKRKNTITTSIPHLKPPQNKIKVKQLSGVNISKSTGLNHLTNDPIKNENYLTRLVNPANKSFNLTETNISTLFDWPEQKSTARSSDEKVLEQSTKKTNRQDMEKNGETATPNKERQFNHSKITILHGKKSLINMYELNGSKVLIVMQPGTSIYFVGILELELLRGCVEVLGCTLNKQNSNVVIFSLQGSCHLYIKAANYNRGELNNETSDAFSEQLLSMALREEIRSKVLKEANSNSTIIIVNRKSDHISSCVWPMFFENYFSFSIFPTNSMMRLESRLYHNIERKLDCLFEDDSMDLGLKKYNQIPEWTTIVRDMLLSDHPKTVLCGGKSVGKSTFLRYITNTCLQKWSKVLILDFDIGQCEFTIGGCISVTIVDRPLLGPNYTHLRESERCVFLGEVDVNKCPQTYIEGCKCLVDYARQHHTDLPWIVNTMGFTRGFGVTLNCGIIRKVSPSHVVQIQSKDKKLNFPEQLSHYFVDSQNVDTFVTEKNALAYKLYVIPSASEANPVSNPKSRGISPAEARNLVVLSYFSETLSLDKSCLTQVIPYKVSLDNLELLTTGKDNLTKDEIAVAMNGNMVALCEGIKNSILPNCHGFGIVRGVDWEERTLYLITPLDNRSLASVNCLVKGNVALPESLLYNQGAVGGRVPYVAHTSGSQTSKFARRDYRPQREDKKHSA